ncbi:hypothetical protein V8F06_012663 [Rhypophila decipiens]
MDVSLATFVNSTYTYLMTILNIARFSFLFFSSLLFSFSFPAYCTFRYTILNIPTCDIYRLAATVAFQQHWKGHALLWDSIFFFPLASVYITPEIPASRHLVFCFSLFLLFTSTMLLLIPLFV